MRNTKNRKRRMALALSLAMLLSAQTANAMEGVLDEPGAEVHAEESGAKAYAEEPAEEFGVEAYTEDRAADADGFEIEAGVLRRYWGNDAKVEIPEGVTSIGNYAFRDCDNLTEVIIPKGVASIGTNVFQNCINLTTIKVEEGNAVYDSRENCNAIIETESGTLVVGCKDTTIPEGVTSIGNNAFYLCEGLMRINIPEGVKTIGDMAFYHCCDLVEVNIPEGVTDIGNGAFKVCMGLTEISLPKEVTSIGDGAFYDCQSLAKISLPENLISIGNAAFGYCFSLAEIIIPEGVKSIGTGVFEYCQSLTGIKIPKGIESMEFSATFEGCSSLKDIEVPKIVTKIGYYAFAGCSSFKNITIPENVTDIGYYAFAFCSGLESITLPEGMRSIDDYAFSGCRSMKAISIPESVVNIKDMAFYDGSKDLIIYGKTGSYAEIYAKKKNIKFSSTGAALQPTEKKTISTDHVSLSKTSYIYDGTAKTPTVTVKDGNKTLVENMDYTVAYRDNVNVGTAKATVTGKDNYTGTVTKEFIITKASTTKQEVKELSKCTITINQTSYTYDGKVKKPTVTIKDGSAVLKKGTDYTVTYSNNVNVGTAKMIVTGKGNYIGTVTKNFTITVRKGTSYKAGSYQYKVTGASTVSMTGIKNNKITKVKVPGAVKIGGKTLKVTAIGSNAFKKNTKIISIEIGDNVKTIGASAFAGCTKLSKVTVGKGVTEIGSNAFKNCKKLGTITIKSAKLKKVGRNALKGIKATAKIKAPAKKLSAYQKLLKNKGQSRKVRIVK